MTYRPEVMKPFSDTIKVEHKVTEATPSKAKGVKPMGGNVGGKHPSILSTPPRRATGAN